MKPLIPRTIHYLALLLVVSPVDISAASQNDIEGQVVGGGVPIAGADVILWEAGPGAPVKLGETQTGADGSFDLIIPGDRDEGGVLYLLVTVINPRSVPHRQHPPLNSRD